RSSPAWRSAWPSWGSISSATRCGTRGIRRFEARPMRALVSLILAVVLLPGGGLTPAAAQAKPEGEMRWALYVTLAPAWFDPAEVVGVLTPFWVLTAMHDALVKPMPGNLLTPSLAESWKVSPDGRVYDFKLREGLKFHNGDPFTAEDVRFSFHRARGAKVLQEKVRDVEVAGPYRVRFHLHEPWPDFMTFYGTYATGAGWIVPEATTRMAMLKRGEVDLAYLLDAPQAQDIKKDPSLKLAFSGGIGTYYLDYLDQWDPKSPWHDRRVRLAASHALDRQALSDAETLGASRPNGSLIPRKFEFALPLDPHPYDPAKAKQLLAEAGYPNGFDAGDLYPWPPYTSMGEAVGGYLGAVGIKVRIRTMERAAFYSALESKKLKGLCVCINAVYGNAASRMSQTVPSDGAFA